MTDILAILPDFDLDGFTNIIPSLERVRISTADILTLDTLDTARRAGVAPADVKRLLEALQRALQPSSGNNEVEHAASRDYAVFIDGSDLVGGWRSISTLDDAIDNVLNGGIGIGHVTEITGESAAGKTQFLLTLALSAQLQPPLGLGKSVLYISTEAQLQTTRLKQILLEHPNLNQLPAEDRPSLSKIQSTHVHDLEAQEHILHYQVPIAIERGNVGLLIVDSIAANYRAEFDKGRAKGGSEALSKRGYQLAKLGTLLRDLAYRYDIAVVVANQVADRFSSSDQHTQQMAMSQNVQVSQQQALESQRQPLPQSQPGPLSTSSMLSTDDPLALDHQQNFFTGWGDNLMVTNFKTPSLGLTWTNQLSTRIALLKEPIYDDQPAPIGAEKLLVGWRRTFKVVFSAWCADKEQNYEIWKGGIRTLPSRGKDSLEEV